MPKGPLVVSCFNLTSNLLGGLKLTLEDWSSVLHKIYFFSMNKRIRGCIGTRHKGFLLF
jgi:hypothetical protein